MQFTNQFELSLPPDEAWPLLLDVRKVVPCMPGAEIIDVIDERTFKGRISVRLGPVGLAFLCDARFEDIDSEAMRARIKANGADGKGRGTAAAEIEFRCMPCAAGSQITIATDLALSGAVAQYGRGVGLIQTVAGQIVAQFARNLESAIAQGQLGDAGAGQHAPEPDAGPGAAPAHGAVAVNRNDAYLEGYRDGYTAAFAAGYAAGHQAGRESGPAPATRDANAGGRAAAPVQAKPIGGFSLIFSTLWATVRGWFTRSPK
ncbi:hypothetical protein GG851_14385 [Bordetella petrii]|nr:hypothetical protein [Bordetella petrii]